MSQGIERTIAGTTFTATRRADHISVTSQGTPKFSLDTARKVASELIGTHEQLAVAGSSRERHRYFYVQLKPEVRAELAELAHAYAVYDSQIEITGADGFPLIGTVEKGEFLAAAVKAYLDTKGVSHAV